MKHTEILFGQMTHGQFLIGGDAAPMVIVNRIDERAIMDPVDVEEYLTAQGYDSYLIPAEFNGQIVYSIDFFRGLP
jgi:hypothetical protein